MTKQPQGKTVTPIAQTAVTQTKPKAKANAAPIKEAPANVVPPEMDTLIKNILCEKRAHDSAGEEAFGVWLMSELPSKAFRDGFGNIHLKLGKSKTIFSSHIDTVHNNTGEEKQELLYDPLTDQIFVDVGHECLGADDGSGVWLMLQMIEYEIPGYYIFHRGEEVGGQGSRWILDNMKNMLKRHERAIAFDRKGKSDIITHQGSRTASDAFATELASMLNGFDKTFKYKKDNGGTFTDTKVYAGIIPECTNISVGYMHQHGNNEFQHVGHLNALKEAAINIEWEKLGTHRDPKKDNESRYSGTGWGNNTSWKRPQQQYHQRQSGLYLPKPTGGGYYAQGVLDELDDLEDEYMAGYHVGKPYGTKVKKEDVVETEVETSETIQDDLLSYEEALMLIERFPEAIADVLCRCVDWEDMEDALGDYFMERYEK